MTADEVVRSIRGKIGTNVAITVMRQNTPHPLTFIVKRALISEESVRFERLNQTMAIYVLQNSKKNPSTFGQCHQYII